MNYQREIYKEAVEKSKDLKEMIKQLTDEEKKSLVNEIFGIREKIKLISLLKNFM